MSALNADLARRIRAGVEIGLSRLPPHLRSWAEVHLVDPPRAVRAAIDPDATNWIDLWEVTWDASSYRVVYDPVADEFGLMFQLRDGPLWYMGPYESGFAGAIECM